MLDKFKQMKQLRDLQSAIQKEKFTGGSNGVEVTVNGAFELKDVKLNPDLSTEAQETAIKEAFSSAMKSAQEELRKRLGGELGM